MNPEQLLKHFDRIAEAPDGVQRLRRFILDMAVRGKLVEQDAANESVARPYATEPTSDKLPPNWRLINFGKHCDIKGGNQPPKSQFVSEPREGYIRLLQIRDLGERPVPTYIRINSTNRFCKEGEILVGRYGASVGKVFWAQNGAYNVALAKFIWPEDAFTAAFAFLLLNSEYFQAPLAGATRSAQAGFNKSDLGSIDFPAPPLAEQHRIVAKVDELMALCDRLEAAQSKREQRRDRLVAASLNRISQPAPSTDGEATTTFREHARFHLDHLPRLTTRPEHIKSLRQTILNLAVRGRLAPQDPNDESADEFLKQLRAKRTRICRHLGLRSQSILTETDVTVALIEIPITWDWSHIDECFLVTGGIQKTPKRVPRTNAYPYVGVANVYRGRLDLSELKQFELVEGELERLRLEPDDILVVEGNGSASEIGRCARWNGEIRDCVHQNHIIRCRPADQRISRFTELFLNSEIGVQVMKELAVTSAGLYNLSVGKIRRIRLPFPPLAEQHRIVAKVDELMAVCDRLEAQLTATQTLSRRLLEAMLYEALAPAMEDAA